MANVQAGHLAAMLDTVDSVRIFNGSTVDEGESLSFEYSIETILDEINMGAMIFREGRFQEMAPTFANSDQVRNTNLVLPILNP